VQEDSVGLKRVHRRIAGGAEGEAEVPDGTGVDERPQVIDRVILEQTEIHRVGKSGESKRNERAVRIGT
jgi:hypothetical protein